MFPGDVPLQLRPEMKESWLVQRLEAPTNPIPLPFGTLNRTGNIKPKEHVAIKDIFSFDYMGAAEFEYGAVPRALQFLTQEGEAHDLISGTVVFPEGTVFYICPKQYEEDVKERIGMWATNKYSQFRTKERVCLYEALRKEKYARTLGWLELDNGFFFSIDESMFVKTKDLFGCSS